ncbi:restriction endonuclease subunit S [Roseateles koreensis]|uniref:Restriction endonuclease subunit S n=1 Tax=Roseateles koreensis TaxID=2987526 RepID=A0ABT5KSU0_9BURK|nr:restriction endonuclease subunit S [Roseateles koreensis]
MSNWRGTTLGDEIDLAYGRALPAHSRHPGVYGVFGSNGLVGTHAEACVDGPGIVVGRKGSVGEIVYSSDAFWPIDTTYYVVNKGDHNWRFLFHLLRHIDLTGLNSHSAVPGLNREDAYSISVSWPSRDEQDDIARVLDSLENGVRLETEALAHAQDLKQAAMRELFMRGLRAEPQKETDLGPIPESWVVEPLRAHHSVASGGTPSRSNPAYWVGGKIPWVKTAEVDYCVIEKTEEHITPAGLAESAAKLLPAGTLLLAMYGQGVTRGRVAILGIDAACNQACAAIRASDDRIEGKYLYHYLVSRYSAIRQLAHGGQQQNLNLDIVRDLPVAFPADKTEQNEIVAILNAIDRKIDLHQQKRAVQEALFKALLHKLMTGEIAVDELDLSALYRAAVISEEATA